LQVAPLLKVTATLAAGSFPAASRGYNSRLRELHPFFPANNPQGHRGLKLVDFDQLKGRRQQLPADLG
jgi:hypothetical protein